LEERIERIDCFDRIMTEQHCTDEIIEILLAGPDWQPELDDNCRTTLSPSITLRLLFMHKMTEWKAVAEIRCGAIARMDYKIGGVLWPSDRQYDLRSKCPGI
jgi:hypothetical protein